MSKDVQAIFLTEADQEILRRVIEGEKTRIQNPKILPPPPPVRNSRGMYIALPQDGITALGELGTGGYGDEEGDADTPGSGLCELFRLADGELHSLGGKTERVYNISRTAIGRQWIQVHQDRFGVWWAVTGGGGTSFEMIRFVIHDPFTSSGVCNVLVDIISRSHGLSTVTEETTTGTPQQVYVRDAIGCFLIGPVEDLVGMGGYAVYMDAVDSSLVDYGNLPGQIMPPGAGDCPGDIQQTRWEIIQMCCRQDRCDV